MNEQKPMKRRFPIDVNRRVQTRAKPPLTGTVVQSVGKKEWLVCLDHSNKHIQLKSSQLQCTEFRDSVDKLSGQNVPRENIKSDECPPSCKQRNELLASTAYIHEFNISSVAAWSNHVDVSVPDSSTEHRSISANAGSYEISGVAEPESMTKLNSGFDGYLADSKSNSAIQDERNKYVLDSDAETLELSHQRPELVDAYEGTDFLLENLTIEKDTDFESGDDETPEDDSPSEDITMIQVMLHEQSERRDDTDNPKNVPRSIWEAEKANLIQEQFTIPITRKDNRRTYNWKATANKESNNPISEYRDVGLRGINFADLDNNPFLYGKLFIRLYPSDDWRACLARVNDRVKSLNSWKSRKMKFFSEKEWWTFHALMLSAAQLGSSWLSIFDNDQVGLFPAPMLDQYMTLYRFNEMRSVFPFAFYDSKGDDPWYPINRLVRDFNENRSRTVAAGCKRTLDESMCSWQPRISKYGGLPHLSFIARKPEPLGTEFKVLCCSETGCLLFIEIQKGMDRMRSSEGSKEHGVTAACTVRLAKATANSGQAITTPKQRDLFIADSWFASVKTAELVLKNGHEFIGPVKTSHAGFPKKEK